MITRLLAALLLLLAAPALAQPLTAQETRAIDRLVAKSLADTGVPSASIAVVRGGRIVLARAYGKQSEANRPADPRAPYQIASISKQFTAAALLLLEDEGKLTLDDKVDRYVPGITGGDRITLRQLLDHTSGLQDYWPQDFSFPAMARPVTPREILDIWARKPLDFEPGTQWQYSNTGYVVAGLVVERVAGMPLLGFLQARIFTPLNIRAVDQDLAVGPGFPQGFKRFALGPVRPQAPAAAGWLYAAGELAMSAEDLAKWNIARLDRALLPADDWTTQETPTRLADGASTNYGLGVVTGTQNGRRFVEHGGESAGFLSENIVFPDDRAAIVVLTNSWSGDAYLRIARGIGTVILPPLAGTTDASDDRTLARVKALYAQLRAGRVDPALLTDNARYYFTAQALADHRASLTPLGAPSAIVQTGTTRLRGGFEGRAFRVALPAGALTISTFADPATGRIEQYIITGAQK